MKLWRFQKLLAYQHIDWCIESAYNTHCISEVATSYNLENMLLFSIRANPSPEPMPAILPSLHQVHYQLNPIRLGLIVDQ